MSERATVEVVVPVDRAPRTDAEKRDVMHVAFEEAGRFAGRHGGRLLGLTSAARGEMFDGQLALKARFAVLVPEAATDRPKVITVDRKPV